MNFRQSCFLVPLLALPLSLTSCDKLSNLQAGVQEAETKIETLRATSGQLDIKMREMNIRGVSEAGLKSIQEAAKEKREAVVALENDIASITSKRDALQAATDKLQEEVDRIRATVKN